MRWRGASGLLLLWTVYYSLICKVRILCTSYPVFRFTYINDCVIHVHVEKKVEGLQVVFGISVAVGCR